MRNIGVLLEALLSAVAVELGALIPQLFEARQKCLINHVARHRSLSHASPSAPRRRPSFPEGFIDYPFHRPVTAQRQVDRNRLRNRIIKIVARRSLVLYPDREVFLRTGYLV
jgi:hypothetical protein